MYSSLRNLPAALTASAGRLFFLIAAVVALIVAIRGEWPSRVLTKMEGLSLDALRAVVVVVAAFAAGPRTRT